MVKITHFETHGIINLTGLAEKDGLTWVSDVRFPTSLTGDGSDAMSVFASDGMNRDATSADTLLNRNKDCDYSSAYVSLYTDSNLVGHGMTFTIGRGNDIVRMRLGALGMSASRERDQSDL
jgi:hypothetical protein